MHRLNTPFTLATFATIASLGFSSAYLFACGGPKKPADHASDDTSSSDSDGGDSTSSGTSGSKSGGKKGSSDTSSNAPAGDGGTDECVGFEVPKLDEAVMKAACEQPTTVAASQSVDVKDKLEVKASAFPMRAQPGNTIEITVAFVNKSKDPLPLYFTINPEPRFEIQVYDAKNKRVDLPPGNPPALPKGVSQPDAPESKVAKLTLAPNGNGRVKMTWQASKHKWAPADKVKGALLDRGYPQVMGNPLPKGKYTLKIVTPLVGVFEGVDHEVSQPTIPIEVN